MASFIRPARSGLLLPLFPILALCLVSRPRCAETVLAKALVADKDTVQGVDDQHRNDLGDWKPANRIRIRNTSPEAVVIDSIRHRADTLSNGSLMAFSFGDAVRKPDPVLRRREAPLGCGADGRWVSGTGRSAHGRAFF